MKYFSFISLGIFLTSMLWTSTGEFEENGVPADWDRIDSLQAIGKLQSALEGTEIILEHAFENKDRENYLRAVFYRIALTDRLYPDQKERVIDSLYAEMERCGDIVTAVLKSILAEYYMLHYSTHRWTIDGRTEIEGEAPEDFNSWTANHFFQKASQLYLQSLDTDLTVEVPNESLGWVVTAGSTGKLFRPSLYHLLFHRALEFFAEADNLYQKARPSTTVDSKEYFGVAEDFIEMNFSETSREDVDFSTRALLLYQRGLKEALDAGEIKVLADLDLHRIRYLYSVCRGGNCDEYYLHALKELAERYSETAVQAEIIYYIADYYKNRGDRYDHNPNNPDRWAYKTALEWAQKAIDQWPKELRTGRNENLIQQIQQSTFSFISESVNPIDEEFLISLQYKNIESIRYEIYKIEAFDPRLREATNAERITEAFAKMVPHRTGKFDLPDTEDYQNHRIELPMPRLGVGNYFLLIQDEDEPQNSFEMLRWADFQISNLTVFNLREDFAEQAVFVLHRLTGEPVADAKVEVMTSDYNRRERRNVQKVEYTGKTNSEGFMEFKSTENRGRYFLRISHHQDTFVTPENYRYSTRNRKTETTERIGFYLDRSIYRPGQIVYFKGIASQSEDEVSSIPIVNRPLELSVRDVNHREVQRISVRTNQYGAFSGNFTLPQGLTGRMSIVPEGFSQRGNFYVEEYKRPTFFVEIDDVKGGYQLGDTIHITGKTQAYSGFPVRDAVVDYQVSRRIHFPWWRERSYFLPPLYRQSISLQQGEIQTDEQGYFSLQFAAESLEDLKDCQYCTYSYEVVITATDAAGEVRSSQKVFKISPIPVVAEVDFPDNLDRSGKMEGIVEIKNLGGSAVDRKIRVEWTKLIPPSPEVVSRLWPVPTQFYWTEAEFKKRFPFLPYANELDPANWQLVKPSLRKEMNTGGKTSLPLPKNSRVGKYRLTIQDLELDGEPVIYVKDYSVFDSDNGMTSGVDPMEIVANKASFTPGENLNLFLGSRLKNFKLLSVLEYTDGFLDYQWRSIQPGKTNIKREITEGDRGGFYYHFIGLYRGRVFIDRHFVKVPFDHKKINIEPLEYTAENQPGSEQKWKFKLTDWKGNPLQARVLASMYDSSLDAILPHQWSLNLYFDRQSRLGLGHGMGSLLSNSRGYDSYPGAQISDYEYPAFNNKNYLRRYGVSGMRMGHPEAMDFQAAPAFESDDGEPAVQAKMISEEREESNVEELQPEAPQLRENFDETVFFFPEVESDEKGVFELDFVMGESMTEWKLQIMALTEDYKHGLTELKATTSSELIVLPNWPRFVMQGDLWSFPVRLINNADSTLEGMLNITVKNALSGRELTAAVVENSQIPFSIGANGSAIRFFNWNIPSDQIGLLSVEVSGSTPSASDGEKRLLPLLSSQVWITESFPVFLKGGESLDKTFTLERGVSPALNKTSFEYTSDPLWLAFQTLPFSAGDEAKNALQYFQIYYINAMALHILNENPALRPTIEKWLKTDGIRGELMKNEEFKDLDLENTPWLRDALAQKVSREKLAVLLNDNQARIEMNRAVRGLIKHQRNDGAFSWFPGGPASWFITQELLTGYARLHQSAGSPADPGISDVVRKALAYSQEEAIHHFNKYYSDRKKNTRDSSRTISTPLVQFLYLKSLLEPWATEFGEWEGIYELAKRDWMKLPPRTQSMLGIVFQIQGNTALAKTVAESLYERTRYENELGRYMPSGHSYHWERLPIGTQTSLIELWSRMEEMKEAVAETQQWLLNHRRTNNWGAHATTSRAIESLMIHRKTPDEYSRPDKISVNQRALPSSGVSPEAGTAYFKESLTDLSGEVSVQIENTGEDMSWGALYHQYFQEMGKVEIDKSAGLPISIERVWMLEKSTDRGPVLVELKEGKSIEVGQTLVGRMILKCDRSIQYVHLSDLRPSTLEPGNQMSGYRYRDGLVYYFSSGDSSTDFFLETLPKGTFVLEYKTTVTYAGEFNAGLIKAQSYFAPEFVTYGKGGGLKVESQ